MSDIDTIRGALNHMVQVALTNDWPMIHNQATVAIAALDRIQAQQPNAEPVAVPMPSNAHADFAARRNRQERLDWYYSLKKLFDVKKLMVGTLKVRDDSGLIYRGKTFDVLGLYIAWPDMGKGHKAWNEYRVSLVGTEFDGDYDQTTIGDHDIEWIKADEWSPSAHPPASTEPPSYVYSRDYEALYDLLMRGGEAHGFRTVSCFGDRRESMRMHGDTASTNKADFIAECQRLQLEWIAPSTEPRLTVEQAMDVANAWIDFNEEGMHHHQSNSAVNDLRDRLTKAAKP